LAAVAARIGPWLDRMAASDATVLAITHPAIIRAVIAAALECPIEVTLNIDNSILSGSCRLAEGQIDRTLARGTYACGDSRVTLELVHPSKAPDDALRTRDFAIVLVEGLPPAGFLKAIAEHVRGEERQFEWMLEAGPLTSGSEAPGTRPWGGSPPAITARQLLLRIGAGTALLLLTAPWWCAGVQSFSVSTTSDDPWSSS